MVGGGGLDDGFDWVTFWIMDDLWWSLLVWWDSLGVGLAVLAIVCVILKRWLGRAPSISE